MCDDQVGSLLELLHRDGAVLEGDARHGVVGPWLLLRELVQGLVLLLSAERGEWIIMVGDMTGGTGEGGELILQLLLLGDGEHQVGVPLQPAVVFDHCRYSTLHEAR